MAEAGKTIMKKRASLCFEKADLTWLASRAAGLDGKISINLARQLYGGDWVDGELHLTADTLSFVPGMLSRMALKDSTKFERSLPLADIERITRRWKMLQHLIDLNLRSGETVSIRCEGATPFAARLEAQLAKLKPA